MTTRVSWQRLLYHFIPEHHWLLTSSWETTPSPGTTGHTPSNHTTSSSNFGPAFVHKAKREAADRSANNNCGGCAVGLQRSPSILHPVSAGVSLGKALLYPDWALGRLKTALVVIRQIGSLTSTQVAVISKPPTLNCAHSCMQGF